MRGAVAIVDRLRAEGQLDLSWALDEAAKQIWELTSFRVWDDLVTEAGRAGALRRDRHDGGPRRPRKPGDQSAGSRSTLISSCSTGIVFCP